MSASRPLRPSTLGFACALAAGAAALVAAGLAPQSLFPSDVANYLDVCYQCARGLRRRRWSPAAR
jgi:hypothetical protein